MQDKYDYFGNKIGRYQVIDVYLDTMGIGWHYATILGSMRIEFKQCTYEKLIK